MEPAWDLPRDAAGHKQSVHKTSFDPWCGYPVSREAWRAIELSLILFLLRLMPRSVAWLVFATDAAVVVAVALGGAAHHC